MGGSYIDTTYAYLKNKRKAYFHNYDSILMRFQNHLNSLFQVPLKRRTNGNLSLY